MSKNDQKLTQKKSLKKNAYFCNTPSTSEKIRLTQNDKK